MMARRSISTLNAYISDYLQKQGFTESAQTFRKEACIPEDAIVAENSHGALLEWWSIFWDIYSSRQANKQTQTTAFDQSQSTPNSLNNLPPSSSSSNMRISPNGMNHIDPNQQPFSFNDPHDQSQSGMHNIRMDQVPDGHGPNSPWQNYGVKGNERVIMANIPQNPSSTSVNSPSPNPEVSTPVSNVPTDFYPNAIPNNPSTPQGESGEDKTRKKSRPAKRSNSGVMPNLSTSTNQTTSVPSTAVNSPGIQNSPKKKPASESMPPYHYSNPQNPPQQTPQTLQNLPINPQNPPINPQNSQNPQIPNTMMSKSTPPPNYYPMQANQPVPIPTNVNMKTWNAYPQQQQVPGMHPNVSPPIPPQQMPPGANPARFKAFPPNIPRGAIKKDMIPEEQSPNQTVFTYPSKMSPEMPPNFMYMKPMKPGDVEDVQMGKAQIYPGEMYQGQVSPKLRKRSSRSHPYITTEFQDYDTYKRRMQQQYQEQGQGGQGHPLMPPHHSPSQQNYQQHPGYIPGQPLPPQQSPAMMRQQQMHMGHPMQNVPPHVQQSMQPMPGQSFSNDFMDDVEFKHSMMVHDPSTGRGERFMDHEFGSIAGDDIESFFVDHGYAPGRYTDEPPQQSLMSKLPTEFATLSGHLQKVSCLSFSPDGAFLASGAQDKKVLIWEVDNLERKNARHSIEAATFPIIDIRLNKDLKLASVSNDRKLRFWDWQNNKGLITEIVEPIYSVDFHPNEADVFASTDSEANLKLWKLGQSDSKLLNSLEKTGTKQVRFHPHGKFLATANETSVNIVDVEKMKTISCLNGGHGKAIFSISWSTDHLISASEDLVCIWSLNVPSSPISSFNVEKITSCTFHPSQPGIAVVGAYQNMYLWNFIQNKNVGGINAHTGVVSYLTSSPTTNLIASCSTDIIKLWR